MHYRLTRVDGVDIYRQGYLDRNLRTWYDWIDTSADAGIPPGDYRIELRCTKGGSWQSNCLGEAWFKYDGCSDRYCD